MHFYHFTSGQLQRKAQNTFLHQSWDAACRSHPALGNYLGILGKRFSRATCEHDYFRPNVRAAVEALNLR